MNINDQWAVSVKTDCEFTKRKITPCYNLLHTFGFFFFSVFNDTKMPENNKIYDLISDTR